jgi:hypothetical protein
MEWLWDKGEYSCAQAGFQPRRALGSPRRAWHVLRRACRLEAGRSAAAVTAATVILCACATLSLATTCTSSLRTLTLTPTITFPTLLAGNVVLACIALKSLGLSSNQIQAAVNVRCAHPSCSVLFDACQWPMPMYRLTVPPHQPDPRPHRCVGTSPCLGRWPQLRSSLALTVVCAAGDRPHGLPEEAACLDQQEGQDETVLPWREYN